MNMRVIITKKHCEGTVYISNRDCPLFRAIKEQHKEFPLKSVGGEWVRDKEDTLHAFNAGEWNGSDMRDLETGRRKYVVLDIKLSSSCTYTPYSNISFESLIENTKQKLLTYQPLSYVEECV